jgi:phospholipid/cholesterol/gamma-HCH transport system substrate-binding protein
VIEDVGKDARRISTTSAAIMEDVQGTMADARRIVHDVGQGQGTVGQLLTDRTLYDRIAGITREAEQTATNLRQTTEQARTAVAEFTAAGGNGPRIAQSLRTTLNDIQEVTSDLAENTEALKRNFLFRGFFNDRGFFDLDSLSREAYQSGALEKDRTAIRIWIRDDVLFERGTEGLEQLTAEGRRRIDSAMADLVRYPRNSPLVIEGYSGSGQGESAYLLSTDRAQLVHDYLLARYRRQATITGVMPMGALAPDSPSSDQRWSGVALTLFVSNAALEQARPQTK